MADEFIRMFLIIALLSSLLGGLGNGVYYYFQMTYLHRGVPGLSKARRILAAFFFGLSSAGMTLIMILGVGAVVYPFFKHQFLL